MKTRLSGLLVIALSSTIALGACTPTPSPTSFSSGEVQRAMRVEVGVIKGVNEVDIRPGQTNVGTATGAALGATGGSLIGRGTRANVAGAIGGAFTGGLLGSAIQGSQRIQGVELTVELDNGEWIAVVQPGNPRDYRVGDRVRVASGADDTVRVTRF